MRDCQMYNSIISQPIAKLGIFKIHGFQGVLQCLNYKILIIK
jgi:hypothetical protein